MDARDQSVRNVRRRAEQRFNGLRRLVAAAVNPTWLAYDRCRHLDLALKVDDSVRKLRSKYNALFLEGRHIASLSSYDPVAQFEADLDSFELAVASQSCHVLRKFLRTNFYVMALLRGFNVEPVLRLARLFRMDVITSSSDDPHRHRVENMMLLRRIARRSESAHLMEYLRLLCPNPASQVMFMYNITHEVMLLSVLYMAKSAGRDLWGPGAVAQSPVLLYMRLQRYSLVKCLIDYGYGFTSVQDEDVEVLISEFYKFRGSLNHAAAFRLRIQFRSDPVTLTMILYALIHSVARRREGFVPVYEKLHKSLGLPLFSPQYIRTYMKRVLPRDQWTMIGEMCDAYESSKLEKSPVHEPRMLGELAVCAVRRALKDRSLYLLPAAIKELPLPERVKDQLRLKA